MISTFEMSDLGILHYFRGLEVKQVKEGIFVSQKNYAKGLLKRLNMYQCKKTLTPMNTNEKMQMDDGSGDANVKLYRSLIGWLNYLIHTRPDITFSVGMVLRYMSRPTQHHLGVAKRILRYVYGTLDYGLCYECVSNFKLFGYFDSDWAGSIEDRSSTSGNVFHLGSGVVTWSSKKQHITTLSTIEVEYVAATTAACQAIWLRRLLSDMG